MKRVKVVRASERRVERREEKKEPEEEEEEEGRISKRSDTVAMLEARAWRMRWLGE